MHAALDDYLLHNPRNDDMLRRWKDDVKNLCQPICGQLELCPQNLYKNQLSNQTAKNNSFNSRTGRAIYF
jgi:hypothetical protein